jgi:hypothetical protein
MAHQDPEAFTLRPAQMILAARAVPVAQVVPVRVALAVPVVPGNTDRVDPVGLRVDPVAPDPAAQVGRADPDTPAALVVPAVPAPGITADLADLADLADPVARADPAHGMEMLSVVTSTTERRGDRAPRPGATVSLPGRTGDDRFRRPADAGTTAPSTTGATRKRRFGIPVSTSGASISSESGSRCK